MNLYSKILELKNNNQCFAVCLVVETTGSTPRKAGTKMLVLADGSIIETIGGGSIERQVIADALATLESGKPVKRKYILEEDVHMSCGGTIEVYIEPVFPMAKLYIFGAGHVGKALAKYATDFGFSVVFIDPRKNILSPEQLEKYTLLNEDYFSAIEKLEFNSGSFSVILTPKHEFDEEILFKIAVKPHAYIGLIGSVKKVGMIRKKVIDNKLFPLEVLDGINMPVGIKFEAESPAEIAISILAKLIDVKNKIVKNQI